MNNSLSSRIWWYTVIILLLILTIKSIANRKILPGLWTNSAYVIVNKSLWRDPQEATTRQKQLSRALFFLDLANDDDLEIINNSASANCEMIPALIQAEYYRRQSNQMQLRYWLNKAASAPPFPVQQKGITLQEVFAISQNGELILSWDAPGWRSLSEPTTLTTQMTNGWLNLSYKNDLGSRDEVIYAWFGNFPLAYWHTIEINAKVADGSFLSIELQTDEGLKRFINYYHGTGKSDKFLIQLQGNELKAIYISLSEPSSGFSETNNYYTVSLQPLLFHIDDYLRACES